MGNHDVKISLQRQWFSWEGNIKMDLEVAGRGLGLDSSESEQGQYRILENDCRCLL